MLINMIMKTQNQRSIATLMLLGMTAFIPSCTIDARAPAPTVTTYSPGYAIATVPAGHTVVTHRGSRYYMVDGVYYRRTPQGYVVVPSPF